MSNADVLELLKTNLGMSFDSSATTGEASRLSTLLNDYIALAVSAIEREGITLGTDTEGTPSYSAEDGMLIMHYATFLYSKRLEKVVSMPRSLRYMLNNRLFSQKAREQ